MMKVLGANVIGDPVFFFPTFYTMREVASTGTVSMDCVRNGLAKYSANYWNDWVNSWSIWIPGYCVKSVLLLLIRALLLLWRSEVPVLLTQRRCLFGRCSFRFVPVHMRMPFVATLSFGYVCLLSFTRGELDAECDADPKSDSASV